MFAKFILMNTNLYFIYSNVKLLKKVKVLQRAYIAL